MEKNYNKVVIILFLSADEKRAKIWHFIGRSSADGRPTVGEVKVIAVLMNDKIMFGRFYCINSTKHGENEENIGALSFITSPHFPKLSKILAVVKYS